MDKKLIIKLAVIIIISICILTIFLIFKDDTENSKIIYAYSTSEDLGIKPREEYITIYENGIILRNNGTGSKNEENTEKAIMKKIEIDKLKNLINNIEKSELKKVTKPITGLLTGAGVFETREYVNLNKKIILYDANQNEKTTYTNEKVEQLNDYIKILKQKYLS